MALNIKSAETDRLARELAALTGESLTEAVSRALQQRLERERRERHPAAKAARAARIREIIEEMRHAPVLDDRSPDEIIGYNELGTFD